MVETVIAGAGVNSVVNFFNSISIKTYGTDEHGLDGKLAEATELGGELVILVKMKTLEMDDAGDKSWQMALLKAVYNYLQMERYTEPLDILVEVDRSPSALAEAKAIEERASKLFALLVLNPDDQEGCVEYMLHEGRFDGNFDRALIVQRALQVYAPDGKVTSLISFFRNQK